MQTRATVAGPSSSLFEVAGRSLVSLLCTALGQLAEGLEEAFRLPSTVSPYHILTRAFGHQPHPIAPHIDGFPLIAPQVAVLLTSNRYGPLRLLRGPIYRAVFAAENPDGSVRPLPFLSFYSRTPAERTAHIRRTRDRLATAHVIATGGSAHARLARHFISYTKGRRPIRPPPFLAFTTLFVSASFTRDPAAPTNDSFPLRKRLHSSRPPPFSHSPFAHGTYLRTR